jgi:predicted ArsR family transcriptional regulator
LEYPRQKKMRAMVKLLNDELDEARQSDDSRLLVSFEDRGPDSRLEISGGGRDVAGELGINGAEALGLFHELADSGYIDANYGKMGRNMGAGRVVVTIPEKGRIFIDQMPDPNARLYEALDELIAALEGAEYVDDDERSEAVEKARWLRDFANQLPASAAVDIASRIATVLGVPGG